MMRNSNKLTVAVALLAAAGIAGLSLGRTAAAQGQQTDPIADNARTMLDQGRKIFRFDTFGDEAFWGDTLKLHQAVAGAKQGGVGPGVSPKTALAVGLKVDVDALPQALVDGVKNGTVDLADPATTVALLNLNAVVGVTGFSGTDGKLRSMGIQCALCHSTVDDSFAPGIGHRLDGWANRDLNVGAIIALARISHRTSQPGPASEGKQQIAHGINLWAVPDVGKQSVPSAIFAVLQISRHRRIAFPG